METATVDDIVADFLPKMFDFQFPIWDESYRVVLETKIVNRYYLEEIGQETWMMFRHYLKVWLNEHMPYYNVLYQTGQELGNIFEVEGWKQDKYNTDNVHTRDVTGNHATDRTNTGTQGNKTEYNSTVKESGTETVHDTDWTSTRDVADGGNYQDDSNVSTARKDDSNRTRTPNISNAKSGNDTTTRTDNLSENSKLTINDRENNTIVDDELRIIQTRNSVTDKVGTYAKLIEYYRDVDMAIINGLSGLFMQIW